MSGNTLKLLVFLNILLLGLFTTFLTSETLAICRMIKKDVDDRVTSASSNTVERMVYRNVAEIISEKSRHCLLEGSYILSFIDGPLRVAPPSKSVPCQQKAILIYLQETAQDFQALEAKLTIIHQLGYPIPPELKTFSGTISAREALAYLPPTNHQPVQH